MCVCLYMPDTRKIKFLCILVWVSESGTHTHPFTHKLRERERERERERDSCICKSSNKVSLLVCVCVCVCVRERERERGCVMGRLRRTKNSTKIFHISHLGFIHTGNIFTCAVTGSAAACHGISEETKPNPAEFLEWQPHHSPVMVLYSFRAIYLGLSRCSL